MGRVIDIVKFIFKNKNDLLKLKKEIADVKNKFEAAKADGSITVQEWASMSEEVIEVLEQINVILEKAE